MKSLPCILVSLSLLSAPSYTQHFERASNQHDLQSVIDTVIITGNAKTEPLVILREMTLSPGAVPTEEAIEYDRKRIYSLGLFNRVDITVHSLDKRTLLRVDVSERWYIIPLPIFGFRDGDPKKPFYGAGLLHNNFRGLNQKILASVVFGYNPSLALFFSDPQIDIEHDLYFSGSLSFNRVRNRSAIASALTGDFDELHYDINATLGKRLTLYESVGLNLGYQIVEIPEYRPGRTVSLSGTDRFIYASVNYRRDTRDLRDYPSTGNFLSFFVSKLGFGESDLSYTRFGADFRDYTPLPFDFTLAARAHGSFVSGGMVPTYNRSYFGFRERIRGHFRTVFEGENLFGTSVELRFLLIKPRTIIFSAIPMPEEFSVWRFGVALSLFGDTGVTWFRGEKVGLRSFASGYGGGIQFLLPYDIVARVEYALNQYRKGQLIFDLRQSF